MSTIKIPWNEYEIRGKVLKHIPYATTDSETLTETTEIIKVLQSWNTCKSSDRNNVLNASLTLEKEGYNVKLDMPVNNGVYVMTLTENAGVIASVKENPEGFHAKFTVTHKDGSPVLAEAAFLVLPLNEAATKDADFLNAGRNGATAFAYSLHAKFPKMAGEIFNLIRDNYTDLYGESH